MAGIVGGAAWALLGSRFFVVRSVNVTGLHRVSRAQVLAAADIQLGLPLIRIDTSTVAHRVDAITQVQSVQASKSWPDNIVIHVTERTPALAVPDGGGYDLIDGAGVVVTSVSRRPARIPEFRPSGPVRASPAVAAAVTVIHELPAWLTRRLVSISAPNQDQIILHLTRKVTVEWGSPGRGEVKERVLTALMRTHASYYDVSSPTIATTR